MHELAKSWQKFCVQLSYFDNLSLNTKCFSFSISAKPSQDLCCTVFLFPQNHQWICVSQFFSLFVFLIFCFRKICGFVYLIFYFRKTISGFVLLSCRIQPSTSYLLLSTGFVLYSFSISSKSSVDLCCRAEPAALDRASPSMSNHSQLHF